MKKLISIILALCMCTFVVTFGALASEGTPTLILGDPDMSGNVTVKDATLIQKHIAKTLTLQGDTLLVSDCDASETVNIKDATWIQKFVALFDCPYPIGEPIATEPGTEPTTETEVTEPLTPSKPDTNIDIYFSNSAGWSTVYAYLYNDTTGEQLATWPGKVMTLHSNNEYGESVYTMNVDVTKYNRVVFNNTKSQTLNAAVSVASSGFYVSSQTPKTAMQLGIYTFEANGYGTVEKTNLTYPTGYNKPIEVWLPEGYDANDTSKKYSVIYLLDGQNQFDDKDPYNGGWGSDEVITSLMKNGGDGIILVGIDNSRNRDSELTPDLGDVVPAYKADFENGTGIQFAEFVAKTVVPYIEANYNVYTDASHTAIAGSSSGGIEAFYIGMEYMDEFGMIGSLSPAFLLFDESTWDEYLSKFDFNSSTSLPRIYFYNGGGDALEKELLPYAKEMINWMAEKGYPQDKMIFKYDEKNAHNEAAWRNVMSEVVSWLFELQ